MVVQRNKQALTNQISPLFRVITGVHANFLVIKEFC